MDNIIGREYLTDKISPRSVYSQAPHVLPYLKISMHRVSRPFKRPNSIFCALLTKLIAELISPHTPKINSHIYFQLNLLFTVY